MNCLSSSKYARGYWLGFVLACQGDGGERGRREVQRHGKNRCYPSKEVWLNLGQRVDESGPTRDAS